MGGSELSPDVDIIDVLVVVVGHFSCRFDDRDAWSFGARDSVSKGAV